MATCQEFKQWLNHQDSSDENTFRQMKNHIQICQTCEKLYQTDMAIDTILKKGFENVDPPPGLIQRTRHKIESQSQSRPFSFLKVSWKTALPALSVATLLLVMLLNPFSGHLLSVEEMVAHSMANHLDDNMEMAFRVGEVSDVGQWFTRRLGYTVRTPDLKKLGLKLLGGRKCKLGKIDAALLFCNSKDKRASLFVINQNDVAVPFNKNRQYIVKEGDFKITLWEEFGMVYAMVV